MLLAVGVLAAVFARQTTGEGQVVDAAMVDGSSTLMALFFALQSTGLWKDEREANLLDGGAYYYGAYETRRRPAPVDRLHRAAVPRGAPAHPRARPRRLRAPARPGPVARAARAHRRRGAPPHPRRLGRAVRGLRRVRGAGARARGGADASPPRRARQLRGGRRHGAAGAVAPLRGDTVRAARRRGPGPARPPRRSSSPTATAPPRSPTSWRRAQWPLPRRSR